MTVCFEWPWLFLIKNDPGLTNCEMSNKKKQYWVFMVSYVLSPCTLTFKVYKMSLFCVTALYNRLGKRKLGHIMGICSWKILRQSCRGLRFRCTNGNEKCNAVNWCHFFFVCRLWSHSGVLMGRFPAAVSHWTKHWTGRPNTAL